MEALSDWVGIAWGAGWMVALGVLFRAGLRLPLRTRHGGWRQFVLAATSSVGGVAVAALAITALTLHDSHLDLTRERLYTPAPAALAVASALTTPVSVTYFYQGQDGGAVRARDMLRLMAQRNPLLGVRAVDPDKQPSLAATAGVKVYNAALIESGDRRVLVQSTDESEFALGIQRVLRENVVTVCFLEGHNEYAADNDEFHTHLEGVAGHSHDDSSALVIETTGHGVGRLRRTLEAQGYDVLRVPLATLPAVPSACTMLIDAGPRTTYLPGESASLRDFLARGGNVLLLYDLGFTPEPGLAQLLRDIGVTLVPAVVVDAVSHYGTDQEMVAVTGYDPHAITAHVSYTFYPGARPLALTAPAAGILARPLVQSGSGSTVRAVAPIAERVVAPADTPDAPALDSDAGPRTLAIAAEGRLTPSAPSFRAVVVGDVDFASNSFYPYMANSDLALATARWLVREDQRVAVNERVPVPPLVLLTAAQTRGVFLLVVGLLPLGAVMAGIVSWWRRR